MADHVLAERVRRQLRRLPQRERLALAQAGRSYARSWSAAAMAQRLAQIYAQLRSAPLAARASLNY